MQELVSVRAIAHMHAGRLGQEIIPASIMSVFTQQLDFTSLFTQTILLLTASNLRPVAEFEPKEEGGKATKSRQIYQSDFIQLAPETHQDGHQLYQRHEQNAQTVGVLISRRLELFVVSLLRLAAKAKVASKEKERVEKKSKKERRRRRRRRRRRQQHRHYEWRIWGMWTVEWGAVPVPSSSDWAKNDEDTVNWPRVTEEFSQLAVTPSPRWHQCAMFLGQACLNRLFVGETLRPGQKETQTVFGRERLFPVWREIKRGREEDSMARKREQEYIFCRERTGRRTQTEEEGSGRVFQGLR
ncbi:unnamed protein product, partial [Protopolystoma xenopodis]